MALLTLTLLEAFELASLFLLALEMPGTTDDDFPDLPETEDTSDGSSGLVGVPVEAPDVGLAVVESVGTPVVGAPVTGYG